MFAIPQLSAIPQLFAIPQLSAISQLFAILIGRYNTALITNDPNFIKIPPLDSPWWGDSPNLIKFGLTNQILAYIGTLLKLGFI